MGRKTETEILTEAIVGLTKAVEANTRQLGRAMGQSKEQNDKLVEQLTEETPLPEHETPQEMYERLSGGLVRGPMSLIGSEPRKETILPTETQTPLGGIIDTLTGPAHACRPPKTGNEGGGGSG